MDSIFIDTCVWIKLLERIRNEEIFQSLQRLVSEDKIKIITSDQLLLEYERNKERVAKSRISSLENSLKNIRMFRNIISEENQKQLIELLDAYEANLGTLQADHDRLIQLCEEIFQSKNAIKLEIKDEILLKAAQRAVNKDWPFFKNKNSIGDAIHYESVISYKVENVGEILYFVTDNIHDFSDKNAENPHPDIKDIFDQLNIVYSINFPKLIEELTETKLSDEVKTMYYEYMGFPLLLTNERPFTCGRCGLELKYQGYKVRNGVAGTHWACTKCQTIYLDLDESY